MRRTLGIFAVVCCSVALAFVPSRGTAALGERVIVVLKDDAGVPSVIAARHALRFGAQVGAVFESALRGYAALVPSDQIEALRAHPHVAYVDPDVPITATQLVPPILGPKPPSSPPPQQVPWGIDRVGADTSSTLAGNGSGTIPNVNVYVIDTGVATHADLNLVRHVNFVAGTIFASSPNTDCNGHGTHVAGTIAARDNTTHVVGVAPGAPVTGVKVLNCQGNGYMSDAIRGVDWVTANAVKPAVANMSLSGAALQSMDDAVRRSVASGVFYAVAAGNESRDACASSPARAGAGTNNGIMTVAATDTSEAEASFSNFGSCVDIWAPGVNVLSTARGGGTATMSGTSMASPHVAGGGALYLSKLTTSAPVTVESSLRSLAQVTGKVSKSGASISREFVGTL